MSASAEGNSRMAGSVTYELALSPEEAQRGVTRVLPRNEKRLEVKVPPGTRSGQMVLLRNALKITDGIEGDILIRVRVEAGQGKLGVQVVSDATFEVEVLKSPLPVLVDFWAPWCGPCRAIAPVTERLAGEYAGRVKFYKLNVDENPLASQKYQVMSIPTVLLFKHGTIADMSVGAVSERELKERIEALLSRS
jgi:thioredoxin 1